MNKNKDDINSLLEYNGKVRKTAVHSLSKAVCGETLKKNI